MTHTEYMAEAGPFTAAEAQRETLWREGDAHPATLAEMLSRLPNQPERIAFTRWFVAHQEVRNRRLVDVAEEASIDLEALDEDSDLPRVAARLREAVRLAREGEE